MTRDEIAELASKEFGITCWHTDKGYKWSTTETNRFRYEVTTRKNLSEEVTPFIRKLDDEHFSFPEPDPVYYRLFVDRDDNPCVVCLQWFDEFDYDQKRFLNEEHYETEDLAEQALIVLKEKAGIPLTNFEKFQLARNQEEV